MLNNFVIFINIKLNLITKNVAISQTRKLNCNHPIVILAVLYYFFLN